MGEGRVQGCVWLWVAVPRPPLPTQRVKWDSEGPGSFSSYFAVPLVVTLKHLPVLSGDWLEPHPNPEIPGGVGCQKWLNPKSRGHNSVGSVVCWAQEMPRPCTHLCRGRELSFLLRPEGKADPDELPATFPSVHISSSTPYQCPRKPFLTFPPCAPIST